MFHTRTHNPKGCGQTGGEGEPVGELISARTVPSIPGGSTEV